MQPLFAATQTMQAQVLPGPEAMNPTNVIISQKIDSLSDKKAFAQEVKPYFDRFAVNGRLDYIGALQFFSEVGADLLGVTMGAQKWTRAEFMRFDFNGDGSLCFTEAAKCLWYNMRELQKQIGGYPDARVPMKSCEQAGYQLVQVLKKGAQGTAALANSRDGPVVIKIYDKGKPNFGGIQDLRSELEAMKESEGCPHILNCYEIFQDAHNFYCVEECLDGGDWSDLRFNITKSGVLLTETYLQVIFRQAVSALDYLHRHAVMHCDIKEDNIMFKSKDYANPHVVLIDFGVCQSSAGSGLAGGTPGYRPPETNESDIWFPRGDIFCMGVVFFQILADKSPSEKTGKLGLFTEGAMNIEQANFFVKTRQPPWHLIINLFPGVMAWLPGMLEKQLTQRPKAPVLLQQPWFQLPGGSAPSRLDQTTFFGTCVGTVVTQVPLPVVPQPVVTQVALPVVQLPSGSITPTRSEAAVETVPMQQQTGHAPENGHAPPTAPCTQPWLQTVPIPAPTVSAPPVVAAPVSGAAVPPITQWAAVDPSFENQLQARLYELAMAQDPGFQAKILPVTPQPFTGPGALLDLPHLISLGFAGSPAPHQVAAPGALLGFVASGQSPGRPVMAAGPVTGADLLQLAATMMRT